MTTVDDLCRSLSGALGLLPVSVFVFDADAVCTLSVGGGDKAGMPQPTIVGRRLLDDYADLPEVVGALRRTLTGQPAVAAATVHGVTWETYFRPLTDDTGRVVGGVGLALDITERTTVDALLQQSELDAQHLLRAIPDQLVWLDAEGHVLASKATRVGHDDQRVSAAAIGSVVDEVLDRRLVAELHTNMRMALANAETRTFDYHVTEGDTERYFEARVVPGRADTVLLMLRDVTERQRLTDELQQAQRLEAIGRLAGGIAHEINTPIQFIGDNVRFLRESFVTTVKLLDAYRACLYGERDLSRAERVAMAQAAEDDADVGFLMKEVPQAAQETLEGVERVATIVGAMKAVGRPSQIDQRPADLNVAIENTLIVSRSEYKHIADVVTDLGDLPPVMCHIGELDQVFLNLVVNAAHAIAERVEGTQERGRIDIRTRSEHEHVRVEISDDGPGIPEVIRHRIFEPFFTTKEVGKGTGQGLSLSRSLVVDRHGGTITVESAPGRGTTFTVRLPVNGLPAGERSPRSTHEVLSAPGVGRDRRHPHSGHENSRHNVGT